jgi:hypothetical protein
LNAPILQSGTLTVFIIFVGQAVVAPLGERERLRRAEERERAAGRDAEVERLRLARRGDDAHHVVNERVVNRDGVDGVLQLDYVLAGQHGSQGFERVAALAVAQNLLLDLERGIAQPQPQHEAVNLRLGERVGAVMLDRVLRGDDHEGRAQAIGHALDRDVPLGHRFKERRLRLRGGAVYLVGEDDVGEDGAVLELESAVALVVDREPDDVGRQEVGGELDALEGAVDGLCERLRERRLADAGDVLDEKVPTRQKRDGREPHGLGLPANHTLDRPTQPRHALRRLGRRHRRDRIPLRGL